MLEGIVLYSISIWFLFYLVNHAEITEKVRNYFYKDFPAWLSYMCQCSFCSTFWITLVPAIRHSEYMFLLVAPVINLFLELCYRKLVK